jgi:hypothetical protein
MEFIEMVNEVYGWFQEIPASQKKIFKDTKQECLVLYHDSLGRNIRNHFKLWETKWTPEIRDGIDYSPNHPDAISQRIIEAVWDKVQKENP